MRPRRAGEGAASTGSWMAGSVSSTALMRSADAAARGHATTSITAIITDMRICMA